MPQYTDTKLQGGNVAYDNDGQEIRDEEDVQEEGADDREYNDAATKAACKQLEVGVKARKARFDEISQNEAQLAGKKTKALRGRHNIPFDSVIARGFEETLMSKIDESLDISFERSPGRQQDKKPAEKISGVCQHERGPDQGMWDLKDLGVKRLAIASGRGIYKKFATRVNGKFEDHFEVVDHWDFVTEPNGGGFLDDHLYKGQMNIFRTRQQILDMVEAGLYDKRQAFKLFAGTSDEQIKKNQELYQQKISRMHAAGIDAETNNEIGSKLYRLTEWVMLFRGKWKYLVFSYDTKCWLQCDPLGEVFSVANPDINTKAKLGRGPWVSWATHFDPFNFWSRAPMDSVRPIAFAMKKVMNLSLDNLEKRNWNMRAYDPNVFNPRDLLWKDQGLVKANIRRGQNIGSHIYNFETPDTTNVTVNLVDYLNNFLGEKTGITPGAQGKSEESKVGIYFGNIQQVADRLGLTNKYYEQAHIDIGVNFQWGLFDHMPESYAVKVIGNTGVEWDEELKREEVNRIFAIRIRGTDSEERQNAVLSQRKIAALQGIQRDPQLRQRVNSTWYLREWLNLGGYDAEDVRVAIDTNSEATDDMLAEAAGAIEEILHGKDPAPNRGATTGFVRKIVEFAWDTTLDESVRKRLLAYAAAHLPIVRANAARKISAVIAAQTLNAPGAEAAPAPGGGAPIRSPLQVRGPGQGEPQIEGIEGDEQPTGEFS